MTALIIQLISGALGGIFTGKLMPGSSLGTIGNSIAGIAGGGLGGQLLTMAGMAGGGGGDAMEIGNLVSSLASGGVGGGALMAIIGLVKGMMNKG